MNKSTKFANPELYTQQQVDRFFEKLGIAFSILARHPSNGGNPFLYFLIFSKEHILTDDPKISTAATNGVQYFWNISWTEDMSVSELCTIALHESGHVYAHHCDPGVNAGKLGKLANIFFDMWVNGMIEADHTATGRSKCYTLWTPKFGERVDMATLGAFLAGTTESLPPVSYLIEPSFLPMTPGECYAKGYELWTKSPRCCKSCLALSLDPKTGISTYKKPWGPLACKSCGAEPGDDTGVVGGQGQDLSGLNPMDSHMESKLSKSQAAEDLLRARSQSTILCNAGSRNKGIGSVPGLFEGAILELTEPTLVPSDFAFQALQRKAQTEGDLKDRSRARRRRRQVLVQNPDGTVDIDPDLEILVPKRKGFKPTFAWLQDTSGSMSDANMAECISEAKTVMNMGAQGKIIPCDCEVYWDKAIEVQNASDLTRFKTYGRGGTDFDAFFRGLRERHEYNNLDLVVVATDGFIPTVPRSLAPPCDVIWVVCDPNCTGLEVEFGKVVHIHGRRLTEPKGR